MRYVFRSFKLFIINNQMEAKIIIKKFQLISTLKKIIEIDKA